MALKATIDKVSKNQGSSPQIDIEVTFSDEKGNSWNRVIQRDLSSNNDVESTVKAIEDEVQRIGQEYKKTVEVEDDFKKNLEGKEIEIK